MAHPKRQAAARPDDEFAVDRILTVLEAERSRLSADAAEAATLAATQRAIAYWRLRQALTAGRAGDGDEAA